MLRTAVFAAIIICGAFANPNPSENYTNKISLSNAEDFILYWSFNDTHITFEMHAKTTGWLGIGISPTGGMANSDIFVGWVKNGVATLTDRHGQEFNGYPPKDPMQNVHLLKGRQCDGWTIIKFKRQLAACEDSFDRAITSDTTRVIFAYGYVDPTEEDLAPHDYHGPTNRGARSLYLLEEQPHMVYREGEIHYTFDLLNDHFHIPPIRTYYNCRMFRIPKFSSKQHVVKVEAIIEPENIKHIHHILLYQCTIDLEDSPLIGTNSQCYHPSQPREFKSCHVIIQGWAVGGGPQYYPNNVGFPLGDVDSAKVVVMEMHYDNPSKLPDLVDSSGLRFTYTPNIREFDAGVMQVGHLVTPYQHIIPPHADSFLNYGDCSSQCLSAAMNVNGTDAIRIFGVLLHSHLLGRRITLRHIRNGNELAPIAKDSAYDFNYQETRLLKEEVKLVQGDSMQVVCDCQSTGRNKITLGGLDTDREMCMAFILYYPKLPLNLCSTSPSFWPFLFNFGIYNVEHRGKGSAYEDLNAFTIRLPVQLNNTKVGDYLNSFEWNTKTINKLSEDLKQMRRFQSCEGPSGYLPNVDYFRPAITIQIPFEGENERNCTEPSTGWRSRANMEQCPTHDQDPN
ncbi:DBH-like monooxygenase protein 1 isoform X2 [Clavelina lepadiformis]